MEAIAVSIMENAARAACWATEARARQVLTRGCTCEGECTGTNAGLLTEARAQAQAVARSIFSAIDALTE